MFIQARVPAELQKVPAADEVQTVAPVQSNSTILGAY
jgi:hypothetical protein